MSNNTDILEELATCIRQRRQTNAPQSYTAKLLTGSEDSLLKKLAEEACEAALAAKAGDTARLTEEMADLWFHCLVVMERYNLSWHEVAAALSSRRGTSGITEKAARKEKQ
ncbi:phosphoribosyl-ATP diphosphatase [Candidatus Persebacteraceae bacterium Df01]|jgi:phosphoribosyl-ATP pyrophosphohydrolase|uniref:Phosphoribosyl-ATP pyrophosphatase n=1 Tax=Candidatus Doriopsillibacter californiensis TaxID=2970740 RepID=A0ABT7QK92_9GAMM|nr:phosphoribosyl-ATP diphosphatase [Candidatus Persebacteraceae bacterium Df01]